MRFRWILFRLVVVLAVLVAALTASAEKCNFFCPIPKGGACCFKIVIAGDQRCNFDLGSTATDPLVNPFAYNGGTSTVSESYDAASNTTTITICGSSPIEPGQSFHYPPGGTGGNGEPHIWAGWWKQWRLQCSVGWFCCLFEPTAATSSATSATSAATNLP